MTNSTTREGAIRRVDERKIAYEVGDWITSDCNTERLVDLLTWYAHVKYKTVGALVYTHSCIKTQY